MIADLEAWDRDNYIHQFSLFHLEEFLGVVCSRLCTLYQGGRESLGQKFTI